MSASSEMERNFKHVGWRWKTPAAIEWHTSYEIEKPDLGFTPEYADKVEWQQIFIVENEIAKAHDGLEKLYSDVLA